jgi:PAS domain-containing protein
MSELTSEVVEAGGRGLNVPSNEFVSALADAAALGLSALAELLTRTEDGLVVVDGDRRYVYANPAACRILGHSIEQLRGRDFLSSFQAREHATVLEHLPERRGDAATREPRLAARCTAPTARSVRLFV